MSMAATRSPSPGPAARPCCGGLRRSADSSPFRPAASPSDSPQRSSSLCKNSGRASPRPSVAEKENDPRDAAGAARTHKVRSSAGCGGGIAKSFMAPTISAASKAVAPSPSPRKRILGERNNDPVPSSPGDLAHGIKPRGPHPPTPEAALGAPRRLRLSLDGEADRVENYHRHHDAASAADAEEAAAPYDPKTNYLSPRPRFLRYKPNPRVEMYRHNAGGSVRRLEDGFASESSSEEVDTTTTTTEGEVSAEDQEQTTLSSVPADDSTEEETSSALAHASVAGAEPAAPAVPGVLLSQPAPDSPLARVQTPERKESARAGGVLTPEKEPAASPARARPKKKKMSPLRFLLAPLALVLFMAAALVCVPPPPGSPVMLNTSLSKVSDFLSVQELHPVELAARLKQWSSGSLEFVTSYLEALASYQEQEVFGPHFAANLSAATVDMDPVGFYYGAAQRSPISVEEWEETQVVVLEGDTLMTAEPDVEELASFGDAEVEKPIDYAEMEQGTISAGEMEEAVTSAMEEANDSVGAEVEVLTAEMADEVAVSSGEGTAAFIQNSDIPSPSTPEPAGEMEEAVTSAMEEANDSVGAEVEVFSAEMAEEVSGSSGEGTAAIIQNSDIPSPSTPEPEQAKGMDEASSQHVQTQDSEGDDGKGDQGEHHDKKLGSDMWPGYLDKISNPAAIGAALAAIIVSAVLAFLYMWQKQARVASTSNEPVEQAEQAEQAEKAESLSGSGSSQGHAKGSQFQNPLVEESERLGGSGTSQYSSSLSSGLGSRRRKAKGEDTSGLEQRVSRRDSTGRSTSSYGSFTTYEKIHAKKGHKEDEAMTPVRRSSRLRNVKSPEA
ncbi:hypothetical protein BS78_01G128800 [Paspalum vaginatum]|nr:hypothetical protein BS78_01G128800 [Paspalum vaginatum]